MITRSDGLIELINDYFYEIVDSGLVKLSEESSYKKIIKEKEDLFSKFPNIKKIIVNEENIALTEKDIEGIRQLFDLNRSIEMLEMQYCYYKGMKDYIHLLDTIEKQT